MVMSWRAVHPCTGRKIAARPGPLIFWPGPFFLKIFQARPVLGPPKFKPGPRAARPV